MEYNPSITNLLNNYLTDNSPIIVFGAGNFGRKITGFLKGEGKNIIAVSDNNARIWNTDILGLKVLPPSDIPLDAVVIVCIWSPENSYVQAKNQLLNIGVVNVFHVAALMQLYPKKLLPYYHFQTSEYFLKYKNLQNEVLELLEDEESKKQYLAHLDCRINLNFDGLPHADTRNQYFPADIIQLSDKEVFLDAGAYTGDTLTDFIKRINGRFLKYLALEPDPKNLEKLNKTVSDSGLSDKIEVYEYAVGAENCTLRFEATGGGGAGISKDGGIEVSCVKIDDKFYNDAPTYLKFDIEGAELDALAGAKQTILTHKPTMAVCIYHLPDDLWTIPLYIKEHYPFYKLYARTHQFDGLDFVLYAIPNTLKR